MRISLQSKLNFLLTLAIVATVTYWILQFSSQKATDESMVAIATSDRVARTQPLDTAPMAGLFGASSSGKAPSEIKLVGVIAQGGKGQGIALLSVGGAPAMAFRVGESVDGDLTLSNVNTSYVVIDDSGALLELSLPERAPPAGIDPVQ
jgi:hypothetical protein